jgi:peptide/nickel transport system permease protein
VGYFFGAVGGYFGGKVDALIMWRNIIWSIPHAFLVLRLLWLLVKIL